jgi:hypothetical protein
MIPHEAVRYRDWVVGLGVSCQPASSFHLGDYL